MIDNISPFKSLVLLSNELSAIRLQNNYIIQTQKNNALIDELAKEIKALVIVQRELKEDREKFIKKDKMTINGIDDINILLDLFIKEKNRICTNELNTMNNFIF